MKKLAAIVLIGVLFFNWYGYRLLTAYWQDAGERRLEAWLNLDTYDDAPPLFIKMPVNSLSYYNSTTDFERVDGQILIDGVPYKYVKRRFFKDSLELICIPDMPAIRLQSIDRDFFRQVNDLEPSSGHGHSSDRNAAHQKNPQKDYSPTPGLYISAMSGKENTGQHSYFPPSALQAGYRNSTERPPDHLSSSI